MKVDLQYLRLQLIMADSMLRSSYNCHRFLFDFPSILMV